MRRGRLSGLLSLSLTLCVIPSARAADQPSYICVVDQMTGFKASGDVWHLTNFKPDGKYVVRPAKGDELKQGNWVVSEIGEEYATANCADFNEYGWLTQCEGFEEFRFNRKTLRFLTAYLVGYVGEGAISDTPSIAIGKCSPI